MSKLNASPGSPIITLWGVPPVGHPIRTHPKVRWLCRTYEGSDQPHVLPTNPSSLAGLTLPQRVARRLREHIQDQVELGADPASLSIFVQNLGYGTSTKSSGTPLLFRAPDDAVIGGSPDDRDNTLFTARSRNGPLAIESTLSAVAVAAAGIRDALKIELQALSLAAPGMFVDDCEKLHEPWKWCTSSGGTWALMTADARAGAEVICQGAQRLSGGSNDLTLNDWISEEVSLRDAGFAPVPDVSWNAGANAASSAGMLRLRADVSQSQHYLAIPAVFRGDAFFKSMVCSNYEMIGNDNEAFPAHLQASGTAETDHTARYFGHQAHAPVLYAYNNSDGSLNTGFSRFAPGLAWDAGKSYSIKALLNVINRYLQSIVRGSAGSRPIHPWIRGIDNFPAGRTPSMTVADLARVVRACRQFPTVSNIVVWFNDTTGSGHVPDWDAMYKAILLEYPL